MKHILLPALFFCFWQNAWGVDAGVTDSEIKLGASVVLTGPLGPQTVDYGVGARLYFDEVNRSGGVNGRKISFKTLDDAFDATKAVENTKKLLEEDRVFLIFNNTGTAQTAAILPIIAEKKTVVFAPVTGASSMREKVNPYLFHVRASYGDEAAKIVSQLKLIGISRVAIFYQDDGLGKTLSAEVRKATKDDPLQVVADVSVDPKAPNFADAAKKISEAKPEMVIMATAGGTFTNFVKALRAIPTTSVKIGIYGFSVVSLDGVTKALAKDARGIVLAQTFPSLRNRREPVINDYHRLLTRNTPNAVASASQLEGFIQANLLVEGLKRAGRNLNADSFIKAMESVGEIRYGKFAAKYSQTSHNGSSYVELAIIDSDLLLRY